MYLVQHYFISISFVGITMYTTLSPCMMCTGTIIQFGIKTVVIGENTNFGGNENLLEERGVKVIVLNDKTCAELMAKFIAEKPQLWFEDIAEDCEDENKV